MFVGNFYWNLPTSFPTLAMTSVFYIIFLFATFVLARTYRSYLRPIVLLIANVVFLWSFSLNNLIVATMLALFGYLVAFIIDHKKSDAILYAGIVFYVLILCFFKYYNFLNLKNIIMPLGLSFYSFKIMSYLFDVRSGKCELQKNVLYYLDYVTFFPTIIAGPINRAKPFFEVLESSPEFDYLEAKGGAFQMLLGIVEKMVFCDYIALITTNIFGNTELLGANMFLGLVLYSFQIYLDFDALSNIAIGSARVLGFNLPKNFNSPYLASNLQEFWHRWHISLSTWFKDYIYIPLGGSRKGRIRKYVNILIVFVVSGLWHGSTLNFLIWGILHGLVKMLEDLVLRPMRKKEFSKPVKVILYVFGVAFNFTVVSFLWLIFRCQTMNEAMMILNRMFTSQSLDFTLIGLTNNEIIWMWMVMAITVIMDNLRSKTDMIAWFNKRNFVLRWLVYFILLVLFIVFGVYGGSFDSSDFIYQFF